MQLNQWNRRQFQSLLSCSLFSATALPVWVNGSELDSDVVIIGGGLGGCAAALASLRNGLRVTMTEQTDWLGGQLTSQGVPPDEHQAIETHGANRSYRELRTAIREYYRKHYQLTDQAKADPFFNPGRGSVSKLCCEPRVAVAVLDQLFEPYMAAGKLKLLLQTVPVSSDVDGDQVRAIEVESIVDGKRRQLTGRYFVDATELGDLLPLTKTEFITGSESSEQTGELHAGNKANPANQQAFTVCFAVEYDAKEEHLIDRPREYDFWRGFVPQLNPAWSGKLLDLSYSNPRTLAPKKLGFDPTGAPTGSSLNLWNYRRIIDRRQFSSDQFSRDVSLINWPQNDYVLGNLVGVTEAESKQHIDRAKQLSLSLLYWLQTEVPRVDGKQGYPGLRLRKEIMGTEDGLAKAPYIRESRRIQAEFTVLESHVGKLQRSKMYSDARAQAAESFRDSVGVGSYPIDLHPSSAGDNYIDFETHPFQIPLGALLPIRVRNLFPACKNIGTTHLTSGCYRLHPVEWGIGEAVGCLVSYAMNNHLEPRQIQAEAELNRFQDWIRQQGVETHWPT